MSSLSEFEHQQDRLDPANQLEPIITAEMRLRASINRAMDIITWGLDYAVDISDDRPHAKIGSLEHSLTHALDELANS